MIDFASSLTRNIARQYDLFQASLEFLQKDRKFLNYGYTVSGKETYEERQERLCLEGSRRSRLVKGTSSSTSASAAESRTSSCRTGASSAAWLASTSPNGRFATPTSGPYGSTWLTSFRFAWEKPSGFPASRTHPWTGSWRSSARSTSIGRASTGERRRS